MSSFICYLLVITCHPLSVICWSFTCHMLSVICWPLNVIPYMLAITCHPLSVICWPLHVIYYPLFLGSFLNCYLLSTGCWFFAITLNYIITFTNSVYKFESKGSPKHVRRIEIKNKTILGRWDMRIWP